jgi:hypothetical protein
MRLVAIFHYPGCWECSGHDEVRPMVYESAEALLVHFDDKMKAYIAAQEAQKKAYKAWEKLKPKPRKHKQPLTEYDEAFTKWYQQQPRNMPGSLHIEIGGYTFYAEDLMSDGKYQLPTILTVDEWFEQWTISSQD